jgi:hypothetical protein
MKLDIDGTTEFLMLPAEEAERIMEALNQAGQANDIEAMKWCARRLVWLDDTSEIMSADDDHYPAYQFNRAWAETLKADPVPDSIAAIIARIDQKDEPQPPTAADAGKALETIKAFFEDNLGGKSYRVALEKLDALRETVKTAEAV